MIFWAKYSQNLDLKSYINKIWKKAWVDYGDKSKEYNYRYGPKEFIDELTDAKDEKSAEKVVRRYWQKTLPPSFEKDNVFLIKWFERFLNEEKDLIIGRLEKVYGEKFPFDEITVYLTTCPFFPYSYEERYFMVGKNSNFFGILNIARHELNHFMFYYYFRDYLKERGMSSEGIEYLKEAMAILSSSKKTENEGRNKQILELENLVRENRSLGVRKIVDLVPILNPTLKNSISFIDK